MTQMTQMTPMTPMTQMTQFSCIIHTKDSPNECLILAQKKVGKNRKVEAFVRIPVLAVEEVAHDDHTRPALLILTTDRNHHQLIHTTKWATKKEHSFFVMKDSSSPVLPTVKDEVFLIQTSSKGRFTDYFFCPEVQSRKSLFPLKQVLVGLRKQENYLEVTRLEPPYRESHLLYHPSWTFAQRFVLLSVKKVGWEDVTDILQAPQKSNLINFANGSGKKYRPADYKRVWTLIERLEGDVTPLPLPTDSEESDEGPQVEISPSPLETVRIAPVITTDETVRIAPVIIGDETVRNALPDLNQGIDLLINLLKALQISPSHSIFACVQQSYQNLESQMNSP